MWTNFFSIKQKHIDIISPNKKITIITQAQHLNAEDLTGGIRNKEG